MLLLLSLLFLAALYSTTSAQGLTNAITVPASINKEPGYITLPACINQCIWDSGNNDAPPIGGDLAIQLGCGDPWVNGCYCKGAEASFAFAFLTSCFSWLCSTTPAPTDIDAGVSMYTSYCSQALGEAYKPNASPEPAPTDAIETNGPAGGNGAYTSRATSSGPKETGLADHAEESGKSKEDGKIAGLSQGAFIGVVVSCSCSVIGLLFGMAFKVHKHKKQTRLIRERQGATVQVEVQPKAY